MRTGREIRTVGMPPVPSGVRAGVPITSAAEAAVLHAHYRASLNNQRRAHPQVEPQGIDWQEHLKSEEQEAHPEVVGRLKIGRIEYDRLNDGENMPVSGEELAEMSLDDLNIAPLNERRGFLLLLSTLPKR